MVVRDIEEAHSHLTKSGAKVSDIEVYPWGRFVYFSDPDGNRWSVQEIQRPG
jgi:predicted enzyme related to lactoylglutathione lyase